MEGLYLLVNGESCTDEFVKSLSEMKAEKERTSLSLGSSSDSSVLQAELKVIQDEITLITERIQLSQHIYTLMYLTAIDSPHPAIITDGMAE